MEKDELMHKLIIIGGSAGSLSIVINIIEQLPAASNASTVIVLHRNNNTDSALKELLSVKTKIPVREIEDKENISPRTIYLAPPDYHLLFENKKNFALDSSEKIHFSRPSIDISFESAAETFRNNLIGILLSGANIDGAAGLKKIADNGGFTIVQKPESADAAYMPESAIRLSPLHNIINGNEIGKFLADTLSS